MNKLIKRQLRKKRIKSKIYGTAKRPRISIFRSNKNLYVQVIDDSKNSTILSDSTSKIKDKINNVEKAALLGKIVAQKIKTKNINYLVFDRTGYKYHGIIKSFAESLRKHGLIF